jgi:hypothetical protein
MKNISIMKTQGLENPVAKCTIRCMNKNKKASGCKASFFSSFFKKTMTLLLIFNLVSLFANASLCTAIANGNWNAPSTWSCGHAPSDGDSMVVPFGRSVTVNINSPVYSGMVVIINGILIFDVGQKINICPGAFMISATGILDGGNPGSKINICGTTVWNGPGPGYGPLSWSSWPLPIELTSFEGKSNDNSISISWTTQTEMNNDYFTLERSTNGASFEEIARVDGNGSTIEHHDYSFTDLNPSRGTNYYRLKQTDFNGQSETFHLISIEFNNSPSGCVLNVYPNSTESNLTITFSDCPEDNNGTIYIQVFDAQGRIIMTAIPERNGQGGFTCTLQLNDNLNKGLYFIRSSSSKSVYQKKAVIN